jgi:hypothetical protein
MRLTESKDIRRLRVLALGAGLVAAALGALVALLLPGTPEAAPTVTPSNTIEPRVSGTPQVRQILRTTRGAWAGTEPIDYVYRWFRCQGRGAPNASDCLRITNASDTTYVVREGDVGFRIRSQVTARNDDGSDTATSNPTGIVQPAPSGRPANTAEPSISGTAAVGQPLSANRGTWSGDAPITYSFQWLRCSSAGENCSEIAGATDTTYALVTNDTGRTIRVRVTARNSEGARSALSNQTAVVAGEAQQPPGNSVGVGDLRAAGDRLVVSQVRFSPNPVTSRVEPITVRIRVTDQRGRAVRGALVFIRSVPRRTTGADRQQSGSDGWIAYQLQPLPHFPAVNGNVQFFVKAYRGGDPALGGIAGFRLVQVRVLTATGR